VSNEDDTIQWKDMGLATIIKSFKNADAKARVGILGGKNTRKDSNTNAVIGVKHEFGDPKENLPIRSFLRMPIIEKMQSKLDASNAFSKKSINEIIQAKDILPWIKKLGVLGEAIVLEAFETGGFGKWKPSNMKFKKNHQTLVETQQLRNSITSEVKNGG
jgi:phage gpG-like protein